MTVDISKIKPGDTVHVKVIVKNLPNDNIAGDNRLRVKFATDFASIHPDEIVDHIPAPRQWKVGDRVTWKRKDFIFVIRAIDGNEAWVGPYILPIAELRESGPDTEAR